MLMDELPHPHTICATPEDIDAAVQSLARRVKAALDEPPVGVAVLHGARRFAEDLVAALPWEQEMAYVSADSYRGIASTGRVELKADGLPAVVGRDVLIIDDILDTGLTLRAVREHVRGAGARSVRSCVLLRKRRAEPPAVEADFVGLHIDDRFVVGYGLDLDGAFRHLPFIAYL